MDPFDKVEELLLAEGYSKEEIPAIMVSLVEQGFDPTAVFLGGLANMLDLLPKKKTTPKAQPPKITTTAPTGGPLGTRSVPTMKDLGAAPKPDGWGGFPKQPPATKAPTTVGTPEPAWRTNTQPTNNVTPRRNNLSLQRTNLRAPSVPAPVAATAKKGLWSRIAPRIAPVAKQAWAAYRGSERLSKGDYLGAALGYGRLYLDSLETLLW